MDAVKRLIGRMSSVRGYCRIGRSSWRRSQPTGSTLNSFLARINGLRIMRTTYLEALDERDGGRDSLIGVGIIGDHLPKSRKHLVFKVGKIRGKNLKRCANK